MYDYNDYFELIGSAFPGLLLVRLRIGDLSSFLFNFTEITFDNEINVSLIRHAVIEIMFGTIKVPRQQS